MITITSGNITKNMLRFALPLLLGNIFQQMYNTADSIIVGRMLGETALAAVGAAGAVMNILLFLIVGISLGASVLIAQYYGSGDTELTRREFGTAVSAGTIFTCAVMAVSCMSVIPILKITSTPASVLPMAAEYLYIITGGLVFTFLYNIMASALCALGDSRAPILFLVISSVLNVAVNVLFIKVFSMGTAGAAWGTVISQAAAAGMCFAYIRAHSQPLALSFKDLRIDKTLLGKTVQYSGTFAVQQSFLYVGVLMVQGAVNTLGISAMAAFNAVNKIDGFVLMPGDSLAASLSTFVAQNHGAGHVARVRASLKSAIIIGVCYCVMLALTMPLLSRHLMGLFMEGRETKAISLGVSYLWIIAMIYPLTAFCNAFQGFYRGLGKMRITLNATLVQIPVRVAVTYYLVSRLNIGAVAIATGIGWVLMFAYQLFEYRRYKKSNTANGL